MTRNLTLLWMVLYSLFLVFVPHWEILEACIECLFIWVFFKLLSRLERQSDLHDSQSSNRLLEESLSILEKDNIRLLDLNRILLKKLKKKESNSN